MARDGAPSGTVVTARHQTAGRGRRGRVWDDRPGSSLLFSVLFVAGAGDALQRFAHALALAVTDACKISTGADAGLKWPNDVLVGDRKLAGVLGDIHTRDDKACVIVGCGINVNWQGDIPDALRERAISLDELSGYRLSLDDLLDNILRALEQRLQRPDWLMAAYRMRCRTIGQSVRVELPDGNLHGRASYVLDDGRLLVDLEDGEQRAFSVGEVVHLRPENA